MRSALHRPTLPPDFVLGYRRDGRPIHPIAGGDGSTDGATNGAVNDGTTITVPKATPKPSDLAPTTPPQNGSANGHVQMFTAEDIEKARQQEKDKLYDRLSKMDEQMKVFQSERDERLAKEEEARKAAEAAAEEERKKNLTFEQKLSEAQNVFQTQIQDLQGKLDQREALFERERAFQSLNEFKTRRLTEESDNILPELAQWVSGTSEEEVEAAISRARETTDRILANVVSAQQNAQLAAIQAKQQARGTGVTAPPVGPMENQAGTETFTADQIREMDLSTYMKHRDRLMQAASAQAQRR